MPHLATPSRGEALLAGIDLKAKSLSLEDGFHIEKDRAPSFSLPHLRKRLLDDGDFVAFAGARE
jgi:hypothetical protein